MLTVGIGEIQKNTAIFANLTEAITIVDKRRKRNLAIVYPIQKESTIARLAGKYRNRVEPSDLDFEQIRELAIEEAMKEKYGISA
jgi:hypothetical protein